MLEQGGPDGSEQYRRMHEPSASGYPLDAVESDQPEVQDPDPALVEAQASSMRLEAMNNSEQDRAEGATPYGDLGGRVHDRQEQVGLKAESRRDLHSQLIQQGSQAADARSEAQRASDAADLARRQEDAARAAAAQREASLPTLQRVLEDKAREQGN